jgi:hypothetical protein
MNLFSTDASKLTDFAQVKTSDILAFLDENANRIAMKAQEIDDSLAFKSDQNAELVNSLLDSQPIQQNADEENYASPLVPNQKLGAAMPSQPQASEQPQGQPQGQAQASKGGKMSIKLSNYGYDSDSSPDYNSNVLKIGNRGNRLEDGVSAALTRSLAKRLGIKKGAWFNATTADGKVLRRRYDDTVPTTYRGKPLPETVDLYNVNGSNSFGGKIVDIQPFK